MDIYRIEYTVIKDKGIVRASISDCCYDAFAEFDNKFLSPSTSHLILCASGYHEKFIMPYKFSAVAKLHPEDEWDEDVGKRIALKKLTERYNHSLDKHIKNMYNALFETLSKTEIYLNDRHLLD